MMLEEKRYVERLSEDENEGGWQSCHDNEFNRRTDFVHKYFTFSVMRFGGADEKLLQLCVETLSLVFAMCTHVELKFHVISSSGSIT